MHGRHIRRAKHQQSFSHKLTWHINKKKLLRITPGTISFIFKSYGGAASDCYINETSGIEAKIQFGDNLMQEKEFNISNLQVSKGSRLIIPPLLRDKNRLSKKNCKVEVNVPKARIYAKKATARVKDFRILNKEFSMTLKDQLDDIFTI